MIKFSQQDPRWKDKKLGVGDVTIGTDGCFLTCFSDLVGTDPGTLNDQMVVHGGFSGSLIIAAVVPAIYSTIWIESTTFCLNNPAPLDVIDKAFTSGKSVIVGINGNSHFVILSGKAGNDYNMIDPWPLVDEPPATLLGRYGKGQTAEIVISYILVLGGVVIPIPEPASDIVTVITDELNLRRAPSTDQSPIGKIYKGQILKKAGASLPGTGIVKRWQPVVVYIGTGVDGEEYIK
jgi:hypothetical protein